MATLSQFRIAPGDPTGPGYEMLSVTVGTGGQSLKCIWGWNGTRGIDRPAPAAEIVDLLTAALAVPTDP